MAACNTNDKGWLSRLAHHSAPALCDRPYRRFWAAQLLASAGDWTLSFALAWAGMQLSPSPVWQGLLGFAQFIPATLLTLFGGAIVDRVRKRTILLIVQSAYILLAVLLGLLFVFGAQSYPALLLWCVLNGIMLAFFVPAFQSYIGEVVPKEHLQNAIAFNVASFNFARIVGPLAAGFLMGGIGTQWCFFIAGAGYIPVLIVTWLSKRGTTINNPNRTGILREIGGGLKYMWKNSILLKTSILAFIVVMMVTNYNILVPLTARDSLHLTESGGGLLMTWIGVGAVLGSIVAAVTHKRAEKKWLFETICIASAVATVFIGFMGSYALTSVSLILSGFTFAMFISMTNSRLQANSSQQYRGRVLSMYSLIVVGTVPMGNLIAGSLADGATPWFSWAMCAAICVAALGLCLGVFAIVRARRRKRAAMTDPELKAMPESEA